MYTISSKPLPELHNIPAMRQLDSARSPSSSSAAARRLLRGGARSCMEAAPRRGPVRHPTPCCSATLEEATLPAPRHRHLTANCTNDVVLIAPGLCPADCLKKACQKLGLQLKMVLGRLQAAGCNEGRRPGQHPRPWASGCIRGTDPPKQVRPTGPTIQVCSLLGASRQLHQHHQWASCSTVAHSERTAPQVAPQPQYPQS